MSDFSFEGFMMLTGGISGSFGVLGTMIVQWFSRDKTKADSTLAFATAVTEMVKNVSDMTKMLQTQKDITDKRDVRIDELERKTRDQSTVIKELRLDLARLVKGGLNKDKRITALEVQRDADQKRISTLERERTSLLEEIDKLRTRLENGKTMATDTQDVVVIGENIPEADGNGTADD